MGFLNIGQGFDELFLAMALTGIVILKQAQLFKRVKSHLGPENTQMHLPKSVAIFRQTYTWLLFHTSIQTLYIFSHQTWHLHPHPWKYTFCMLSLRQQEHDHSHFMSWKKNTPLQKQPVREVHELCTSKNVIWCVGSSPSHLDFLQQTFDCD